jgi:IS30 family transposase
MGRKLRYLGPSERAEIERLHNGGAPAAVIAGKVGSHVATIYRELPNGYTGAVDEYGRRVYSAEIAQRNFERSIKRRGERARAD